MNKKLKEERMLLKAINEIYDEVEEHKEKEILNKAIKTNDKNKIKEGLIETIFSDYYKKCYECKKIYPNRVLNYDNRLEENFCDDCYKKIEEERNKKHEQNQKIASKNDLIIMLNKALIYNKKEEIQQIIDTCFK
jgi:chorismate mutase